MIALSIGGIDIYRYGIMYAISFLIGYILLYAIAKSRIFASYPKVQQALTKDLDTLVTCIIVGTILGGRLGYVLLYDRAYFSQNPTKIFAVREGGMAFAGGIIGVALTISIRGYYKKRSRADTMSIFDTILSIVPIGIILGRIGNFLNQEIYGIVVPENRWGLPDIIIKRASKWNILYVYETIDTQLRVNTNFLAAFFEGGVLLLACGGVMLYSIYKKTFQPGKISKIFIFGYGSIRFILEYLRVDSQTEFIGWFTKSQYFFIGLMIIGCYLLIYHHQKTQ